MNQKKKNIDDLLKEYYALLNSIRFDPSKLDYGVLDKHLPFLETLDAVSNSSVSIFDLYKRDHIYLSSRFETTFGWNNQAAEKEGTDYFNSRVHPDDMIELTESGTYFLRLGLSLSSGVIRNYKAISDYRVMHADGYYVRVVEQKFVLEFTADGTPWLGLCIMDLSPFADQDTPYRSRLVNIQTGEIFLFPPESKSELLTASLTSREKEILKLVSEGLISKQIADKLYISVNTVNTHRQRIIEKLNVSNTFEAIRYATKLGWLNG